jgi:hypothetical protein
MRMMVPLNGSTTGAKRGETVRAAASRTGPSRRRALISRPSLRIYGTAGRPSPFTRRIRPCGVRFGHGGGGSSPIARGPSKSVPNAAAGWAQLTTRAGNASDRAGRLSPAGPLRRGGLEHPALLWVEARRLRHVRRRESVGDEHARDGGSMRRRGLARRPVARGCEPAPTATGGSSGLAAPAHGESGRRSRFRRSRRDASIDSGRRGPAGAALGRPDAAPGAQRVGRARPPWADSRDRSPRS